MDILISLIVYVFCFGISLFICNLYQNYCIKRNYKEVPSYKKLLWFILIIASPVLISAIRYDVGTDFFSYIRIYENINHFDLANVLRNYGNEPLYLLINKIAFLVFREPWGVFFLSALIIHLFIIYGIDYFKKYISMPTALFIYYMFHFSLGLNIIRQMIAVSVIFFAFRYIYQKRFYSYFIFLVIATMFHNSAVICVLFYFLVNNKCKGVQVQKKYIYYFALIFTPFIILLMLRLLKLIPFFYRYTSYITGDIEYGIGFLIYIAPIIAPFFIFKKSMLYRNKMFEPFILISLLNFPFQYVGYYVNWGSRLVLYTNSIYYILVPYVISSLRNRENKILISLYYVLLFVFYYIYRFVVQNNHEVFPYNTIINNLF
ncbi:MAG: EpsG family protein [bacterium]